MDLNLKGVQILGKATGLQNQSGRCISSNHDAPLSTLGSITDSLLCCSGQSRGWRGSLLDGCRESTACWSLVEPGTRYALISLIMEIILIIIIYLMMWTRVLCNWSGGEFGHSMHYLVTSHDAIAHSSFSGRGGGSKHGIWCPAPWIHPARWCGDWECTPCLPSFLRQSLQISLPSSFMHSASNFGIFGTAPRAWRRGRSAQHSTSGSAECPPQTYQTERVPATHGTFLPLQCVGRWLHQTQRRSTGLLRAVSQQNVPWP